VPTSAPSVAAPASAPSQPMTKIVQVVPSRDFGFLPAIVASGRGFFAEQGLDVELPMMATSTAISALLAKEVQIGSAGSSVRAAYQGAPLRAIFYYYNYSTFQVVGASELKSFNDLRGKSIGVDSPGSSEDAALKLLLKSKDIPLSDVNVITLGPRSQRIPWILSGQVQFTLAHPDLAVELEQQGFNVLGNVRDILPIPWSGFAVHQDTLREQPELLKAWIRAGIRTLQFIKQNPSETVAIAVQELGMSSASAERALELLQPAISAEDPGGFTEAGLLLSTQIDLESNNLPGDPAELGKGTHDVTLLRQVQRELGIRCTTGYQCQ
jgi:ABC-type nitrate/sulfonate/bicarbonate transport system substrate-binding protein